MRKITTLLCFAAAVLMVLTGCSVPQEYKLTLLGDIHYDAAQYHDYSQFGLTEDDILDGVLCIVPFAVLCARLYYCIFSWDSYKDDPISMLYIWDVKQLEKLILGGLEHKGFSFIHIVSPCVQYNKVSSFEKIKELVRELPDNHDTEDRANAMKYAFAPEGLYTGVFYKTQRPTYEERYEEVIEKAKQISGNDVTIKDIIKQFQ